jgi:hypothetical protein
MKAQELRNQIINFDNTINKIIKEVEDKLLGNKLYFQSQFDYKIIKCSKIEIVNDKIHLLCRIKDTSADMGFPKRFVLPFDILENPHWHLKVIVEKIILTKLKQIMDINGGWFRKSVKDLISEWDK